MTEKEEQVPTAAYLIGEPVWQKIVWNENDLQVQTSYESLDEVKQTSEEIESFEYSELVRRKDVKQLIQDIIQYVRQRTNKHWSIDEILFLLEEELLEEVENCE